MLDISPKKELPSLPTVSPSKSLTPASIVQNYVPKVSSSSQIPKPRGQSVNCDAELLERERGNKEFSAGNFAAAVKIYTKCLGMKAIS